MIIPAGKIKNMSQTQMTPSEEYGLCWRHMTLFVSSHEIIVPIR